MFVAIIKLEILSKRSVDFSRARYANRNIGSVDWPNE